MRGKGITYDTGFFRAGSTASTREVFDPEVVGRELAIIRRDLHCNAVRVTGGDPDRLEVAARHAAEAGLEVWWSPFTCDLTAGELLDLLGDCAERAERLRRQGAEVVLLTGSELSCSRSASCPATGWRTGSACWPRRVAWASCWPRSPALPRRHPRLRRPGGGAGKAGRGHRVRLHHPPRGRRPGRPWRRHRRMGRRRQTAAAAGRPSPRRGRTGDLPAGGAGRLGRRGGRHRVREHLRRYDLPHRSDPRQDLDMASYGVVKVLGDRPGHTYPDMAWEPKAAFTALADHFNQR